MIFINIEIFKIPKFFKLLFHFNMDIFSFSTQEIIIGKIKCNEGKYLEIFNLEVCLPRLECINGVCQKINPSIKKDIFFLDMKIDGEQHQELILKIREIEKRIISLLENEHLNKINYFFESSLNPSDIKNVFKSSLLESTENYYYLRAKLPHDNIQFLIPVVNQELSYIEDIKFGIGLSLSIICTGVWFSNQKWGLSWNVSKIII